MSVWDVLRESLLDTLPVIPILLPVYVALEYFSHRGGRDLVARLHISRGNGPLAGTLLGIIPQCGMSVLVTSFYLLRRVTTGTLLATYVATSDEAIPVLLASGGVTIIGALVLIKAVAGIGWGYAVDAVWRSDCETPGDEAEGLAPESAIHMASVRWSAIFMHALRHSLHVFGIVFVATVLIAAVLNASSAERMLQAWQTHAYLQVVPAAVFGLIPNCAVSVAIVEAFMKGALSPGAAIAGLCAGAGFGPILLVKDGDRRRALRMLVLTLCAAIVTGLLLNWIYPSFGSLR